METIVKLLTIVGFENEVTNNVNGYVVRNKFESKFLEEILPNFNLLFHFTINEISKDSRKKEKKQTNRTMHKYIFVHFK